MAFNLPLFLPRFAAFFLPHLKNLCLPGNLQRQIIFLTFFFNLSRGKRFFRGERLVGFLLGFISPEIPGLKSIRWKRKNPSLFSKILKSVPRVLTSD